MEVYRYADVSIGHLTKKDNELLQGMAKTDDVPAVVVYEYEYGYFVPVPSEFDENDLREAGLSESFLHILRRCQEEDIYIVRFDRDAPEADDLACFDW